MSARHTSANRTPHERHSSSEHPHDESTPNIGFAAAAMVVTRTTSARSTVRKLTPAGHRTETKHLTEMSETHPGEVGEMAKKLAGFKHFSADVTNFIEELQAEIQQEEQRLEEHLRNQPASPGSPLSGPLLASSEGGTVRSSRPPAASPATETARSAASQPARSRS